MEADFNCDMEEKKHLHAVKYNFAICTFTLFYFCIVGVSV